MADHRRIEAQRKAPPVISWDSLWDGLALGGFAGTIGGRRGGARTRDELEQLVNRIKERNSNLKHVAGSRKHGEELGEEYIPNPAKESLGDGRKRAIYPDATFKVREGDRKHLLRLEHQDVDRKTGKATLRELDKQQREFRYTQSQGYNVPWSSAYSVLKQHQLKRLEEALKKSRKKK